MNCYATIITSENYMQGVRTLKRSLEETGTQIPLVVFMPGKVAEKVEWTDYSEIKEAVHVYDTGVSAPDEVLTITKNSTYSQWANTFDKLLIFDGISKVGRDDEYGKKDKIVFLDSDMMIMQNIDELFGYPHMSAVSPSVDNADYSRGFNSGLMVIDPEAGLSKKIMESVDWESLMSKFDSLSDNDVLINYYKDWNAREDLHLDDRYNFLFPHSREYEAVRFADAKAIHFTGRVKPWDWDEEILEKICLDDEMREIAEKYIWYCNT